MDTMSASKIDAQVMVTLQLLCEAGVCNQIGPDLFQFADMPKAEAEAKLAAWKAANPERVRALEAAINTQL
jgi:hypothetical protein